MLQVDLQKETLIKFLSLEVSFRAGLDPDSCGVNKGLRPGRGWEGEGSGKNSLLLSGSHTGRGDPVSFPALG